MKEVVMRLSFPALMLIIFVLAVVFLTPKDGKLDVRWHKPTQQNTATTVARGIDYIKEPRAGLCFAYYWGGAANGGPALATVPCEKIPPDLLKVGD